MIFLCTNSHSNAAFSPLHSHSDLHPNLDALQYPFTKYFHAKFSGTTIPIISEKESHCLLIITSYSPYSLYFIRGRICEGSKRAILAISMIHQKNYWTSKTRNSADPNNQRKRFAVLGSKYIAPRHSNHYNNIENRKCLVYYNDLKSCCLGICVTTQPNHQISL